MISKATHSAFDNYDLVNSSPSLKEIEDSLNINHFKSVINHYHTTNTDQILKILSCKVSNFWGYEVRLASENASDLLICVSEAQKNILLHNLQNPILKNTEWDIVRKIIELWNDNHNQIAKDILNIWLEFDQKGDGLPNPNFFFAPNPVLNAKLLKELFQSTFNETLPTPLDHETLNVLQNTCKSLPYEAWMPQVGMMLARNHTNIRAYLHKIPHNLMVNYLDAIGWKYAHSEFRDLFEQLKKFSDCIDLDLDISQQIGNTIGLECYFNKVDLPNIDRFLDFLKTKGYACDKMANKLLEYIEKSVNLNDGSYREFLHHIKIIYNPTGACEAKAYLAIRKNNY